MDEQLNMLHKRNILLTKLYGISIIFGIITEWFVKAPMSIIYVLIIYGLITSSVLVIFTKNKIFIKETVYIITVTQALLTFTMLNVYPHMAAFSLVYMSLIFVSLYHSIKPIILSGMLNLSITNYLIMYRKEEMFHGYLIENYATIYLLIIICTGLLVVQCIIGTRMQKNLEEKEKEARQSKEKVEETLFDIEKTIHILEAFKNEFKHNITLVEEVTKEIQTVTSQTAHEINKQADSAKNINEQIVSIDKNIISIADKSKNITNTSDKTKEKTYYGHSFVIQLSKDINQLSDFIIDMNEKIISLEEQNNEINGIIKTIDTISSQTNLLALNASIEAARAGEAGKGFMVVAEEVKKLADNSKRSTVEIANIISHIKNSITDIKSRSMEGKKAVEKGEETMMKVNETFDSIHNLIQTSHQESLEIYQMGQSLKSSSSEIVNEVVQSSRLAEHFAAIVEEILGSIDNQNDKLQKLLGEFVQLEKITKDLSGHLK